jgi:hypothetical protein
MSPRPQTASTAPAARPTPLPSLPIELISCVSLASTLLFCVAVCDIIEKAVAAGAQTERPRPGVAGEFRFRDSCSPASSFRSKCQ